MSLSHANTTGTSEELHLIQDMKSFISSWDDPPPEPAGVTDPGVTDPHSLPTPRPQLDPLSSATAATAVNAGEAAVNEQRNTPVMDLLNQLLRTLKVSKDAEARRTQQLTRDVTAQQVQRRNNDMIQAVGAGWEIVPSMHDEMLSLFESHTAQVNMRGSVGETLLHLVCIMMPDSDKESDTYKRFHALARFMLQHHMQIWGADCPTLGLNHRQWHHWRPFREQGAGRGGGGSPSPGP